MEYPYLGYKVFVNEQNEDKNVVIMFTSENEGTVIVDETNYPEYKFGKHGKFPEDEFDFLPPSIGITTHN
jgi:hypothetical protein